MSLWQHRAVIPSVLSVWNDVWTTTPSVPSVNKNCHRYVPNKHTCRGTFFLLMLLGQNGIYDHMSQIHACLVSKYWINVVNKQTERVRERKWTGCYTFKFVTNKCQWHYAKCDETTQNQCFQQSSTASPRSHTYTYSSCTTFSPQYLAKRSYCKTSLMESLIATYLPADLMERHKVYQEEMAELSK